MFKTFCCTYNNWIQCKFKYKRNILWLLWEINYGRDVIKYIINLNGFIKFDHAPTVNDQQRRSFVTCTTTRRKPLPRDAIKCKYLLLLRILMKSAERIQMATNETESCYTCESICMPIKLLIKHTCTTRQYRHQTLFLKLEEQTHPKILYKPKKATSQKNENPYPGRGAPHW